MSDKRLEELELAAFMQDINRIAERNGIENFYDKISEVLPSGFSIEPIRSLIEGNGELSWILDKAEEVSRGNDGAALELGSHLKSIAASVSLFDKRGLDTDLPLSVRNGKSCIPGSTDTSSIKELFSEMLDDMKELTVNKNFSSFFFALDSLFEHYLSAVPSASSCVSLYQKAKIKVAIASSLYLYAADNGVKEEKPEERPFVLLSGDATGIQKYIFGVNTYKHSVKMIRARSFQIWIQSLLIAGHICSSLGLTNSNIITFSGGKFLLLLPNTDALMKVISNTRYEVDNLCLSEYSGEIAYIISDGVKCTQNELEADNNLNIQKRIRIDTALYAARLQRFYEVVAQSYRTDILIRDEQRSFAVFLYEQVSRLFAARQGFGLTVGKQWQSYSESSLICAAIQPFKDVHLSSYRSFAAFGRFYHRKREHVLRGIIKHEAENGKLSSAARKRADGEE